MTKPRTLKDGWKGRPPKTIKDIPTFIDRPLNEQLAIIIGRVEGLERIIRVHDEILGDIVLDYAEEAEKTDDLEPITTIEEAAARLLSLEARVTAFRGAMDFLGTFEDRDPLGASRKLDAAKLSYDMGLVPVNREGK